MADDGACECLTCVLTKDDLRRLAEESRRTALVEAYWKLRDHAAELRDTKVHARAQAAHDADPEDTRKYARYAWLESNARGIEVAARDLAEMLGVPEHEIERPVGAREVVVRRTLDEALNLRTYGAEALIDVIHPTGEHTYWSTHCRHDDHEACSATRLYGGPAPTRAGAMEIGRSSIRRDPAQCRHCAAPCICPCHTKDGDR